VCVGRSVVLVRSLSSFAWLRALSFRSLRPRPPSPTLFPYTTLFRSREIHLYSLRQLLLRDKLPVLFLLVTLATLPTVILQVFHRSEEHTSELQSRFELVCRLLLAKKKAVWHRSMTLTSEGAPQRQPS